MLLFVLSMLMSWAPVIPMGGRLLADGTALSAILLLVVAAGRQGLSRIWQRVGHWRVAWKWYVVAPGIVVDLYLGTFLINLLLGATVASTSYLQPWFAAVLLVLQLLPVGGQWEERGWTGYTLPYLHKSFTPLPLPAVLPAAPVTGAFRAFWRLIVVLYSHISLHDAVLYSLAIQFISTWLYVRTKGRVLIVMLFHLASNIVPGVMLPLFDGADQTRYWWLSIALAWAIVLVIVPHSWFRSGVAMSEAGATLDFTS